MSEEQLKAFLEKIKADTSLQEKLKAAADAEALIAMAKDAGFMISVHDISNAPGLSEKELENVAGGGNERWCDDSKIVTATTNPDGQDPGC